MQQRTGQGSLAEVLVSRSSRRAAGRLDRIATLIDWDAVAAILSELRQARTGRPAYPPVVMMRALLLAQWYRLSDPELEEALADRLSFRRFVGLSMQDRVPDETTLCRFRAALAGGLADRVMAEVERQLAAAGLILKQGTIIDATVVAAAVPRPPRIREASPRDPDARWLSHGHGRIKFGYKAQIAVDEGSGLIRKALLTPASVHDSLRADALIMGDEAAVYADRAYAKTARRRQIRARGAKDRIMHKGNGRRAISVWEARHNKLIATVRSRIERTFGIWKLWYGYRRVRYRGLARNNTQLQLLCIAFNLRRALVLQG